MNKLVTIAFFLLATAPAFSQDIGTDGAAIISANPDHSTFMAYAGNNNVVEMRWGRSVNNEIDHFIVEHSTDGQLFDPLHELVAKDGVDPDSVYYHDADAFPANPVNFYRLTTVLKNGQRFSSEPVKVVIDAGRTPALVPTVLHSGGTLRIDKNYRNKLMIVEFFSPGGKWMAAYQVNSSTFNVNTSAWQRGLYFYRISDEGHALVDSGKILVE